MSDDKSMVRKSPGGISAAKHETQGKGINALYPIESMFSGICPTLKGWVRSWGFDHRFSLYFSVLGEKKEKVKENQEACKHWG
ncbi:MAG: hypothetical protein WCJ02_09140 [bacterium]